MFLIEILFLPNTFLINILDYQVLDHNSFLVYFFLFSFTKFKNLVKLLATVSFNAKNQI